MPARPRRATVRKAALAVVAGALLTAGTVVPAASAPAVENSSIDNVIPAPETVRPDPATAFELTRQTSIQATGEAAGVGEYLAGVLRPSTGFPVPVNRGALGTGDIVLALDTTRAGGSRSTAGRGWRSTAAAPRSAAVRAATTRSRTTPRSSTTPRPGTS